MVIATGCIEQPAVFANNDLPGVMLASAAQRLIYFYRVKPCERCLILAGNAEGYACALDLHGDGVHVEAIADLRPGGEPGELGQRVAAAGIRVYPGHGVLEAIPGPGKASVKGAVLCPIGQDGKTAGIRVECDGILMSVGWAPNAGLLYQAGRPFPVLPRSRAVHSRNATPRSLRGGTGQRHLCLSR